MLVLQRDPNESITLRLTDGGEIVVKVLRVRGNSVSIGVEADRCINIRRTELPDMPPSHEVVTA